MTAVIDRMPTSSLAAQLGLARAKRIAADQAGIASRRALITADVPRWLIRRELRVGRWQRTGRQTVAVHNGPVDAAAKRWIAVLELGPRAALAGVTALQHDGIKALTDTDIHVFTPKGAVRRKLTGVVQHESRRWTEEDIVDSGLRRTRPAVSAVSAALWAVTKEQGSYFLILAVQQGLCRPEDLATVLERVRRHRFRKAMVTTVADLVAGVRSVGELDVARRMRSRGLPEPTRQSIRVRPSGTQYLDAEFEEYDLVAEIDGIQHDEPWAVLKDTVRDLTIVSEGRQVLRIPLIAWRLDGEAVLDALEAVFRSRGWRPPPASAAS